MEFFWVLGVIGFVVLIIVLSSLLQTRCPACGRFFAAEVLGEEKIASVTTEDFGYDPKRKGYGTMQTKHKGYLVSYRCRRCDHAWQRMRSTSRTKRAKR